MALTFGNMDQQVQQQADAFSDNPAALQQRYQQSQQLLDLLALQKIKSDKEAAAREMQMQMEQRPQTIAQQREAEVMGLTKNELAKQMGGIMAQRQAAEQSNIKRAASGQPPRQRMAMAPPMRNPRTEGVASQRADNMVNMAQGGVVGFKLGGQVQALLNELGVSEDIYNSRPELKAKIDAIIAGRGEGSQYGRDIGDPAALRRALSAEADKARRERPIGGAETLSYLFGTQEGLRDLEARNAAAQKQEDLFRGAAQRSGTALSSLSSPSPSAPSAPNAAVPGPMMAGIGGDLAFDTLRPAPPAAAAPAAPAAPPPALAAPVAGITTVPRVATPTFGDYRAQEAAIGDSYRKQGILDEYKKNEARRAKMIADQQAARTRNPLRGLMTGASAFGRMGRGIAATREAEAAADLRNLGLEIGDVEKRLGAEEKISGAQIIGATNRIKYATDIAIANANNETKAAVSKVAADASNYAAQLRARYQNATTENQKRKIAIDAENAKTQRISELLKLRDAQIQGLLFTSADPEERKTARKALEETYKPLLLEVRRQFDRISGKSSLPNSADGVAILKTSP